MANFVDIVASESPGTFPTTASITMKATRIVFVLIAMLLVPQVGLRAADAEPSLVASIEKVVVLRGRDGSRPTWFHPRGCIVPTQSGPMEFMTLQTIMG